MIKAKIMLLTIVVITIAAGVLAFKAKIHAIRICTLTTVGNPIGGKCTILCASRLQGSIQVWYTTTHDGQAVDILTDCHILDCITSTGLDIDEN